LNGAVVAGRAGEIRRMVAKRARRSQGERARTARGGKPAWRRREVAAIVAARVPAKADGWRLPARRRGLRALAGQRRVGYERAAASAVI
jgi:hypothetical protein